MKITFLFVDKTKKNYIQQGTDDYLARLRHYTSAEIKIVKGSKITLNADQGRIVEIESNNIISRASPQAYWIALESTGEQFTSVEFADFLTSLEKQSRDEIIFITGGPLGLSPSLLKRCHRILSLSKMTFTHEMCRLVLIEQIYRAYTIKAGGKYHK